MNRGTHLAALAFSLLVAGCGGGDEPLCTPGASVACVGTGGCAGGQVCNADGTGFGACSCGPGPDGGTNDSGMNDSGTTDHGTNEDAAAGPCDLVAQSGCGNGQRCTWVRDDLGGGGAECASAGTIPALGECVASESGEVDDCVAGHACVAGLCHRLCSTVAGCGANFACTTYADFVDDGTTGVCSPLCDPVSQTRLSDDAPACGSSNVSSPTIGCYGPFSGPFTCNRMADGAGALTHGTTPLGPPSGGAFRNGCAPGYLAVPTANGLRCRAFCTPAETTMGNDAQRQGVAPHTCSARGATAATEECRFAPFLLGNPTPATPGVGLCIDPTQHSYDHDANPQTGSVAWPSCSTLTSSDGDGNQVSDHIDWGCGQLIP